MRKLFLVSTLFSTALISFGQSVHVGLFGGVSNYQGDLVDKPFVARFMKPAVGLTAAYEVSDNILLRAGFTYAAITGDDKYNTKTYLQERNLNFTSTITEFSVVGDFSLFNLYEKKWTPYIFGGVALFHFNPYTTDAAGQRAYLKPLSTEGQGLSNYPDNKPYSLTQLSLPFGGGFRYAISDDVRLGLEMGIRKTFTDYLDDLSTNYADEADLLAARGQLAVDLAYRGDEVPSGNPAYPTKGAQRGGAEQKDYYYFTGLTLSFRLGGGDGGSGGFKAGSKRKNYGCPKVPY
jgi:hypothetical protein